MAINRPPGGIGKSSLGVGGFVPQTPPLENISIDKYQQPFDQPRLTSYTAGRFAVALIASGFIGTLGPVSGSGNVAFASTNTIVPYSQTLLYQSIADRVPLAIPSALPDRWVQPFSQPTLRKGPNAALQAPALSWGYSTPIGGTGTDDVRFSASQTIVPYEQTLLYQSIAQPVQFATAETITVDKWLAPFSTPVRAVTRPAPEELFFVGSDTARDNRWLALFSEPVRRKPTVQPDALAWAPFTQAPKTDWIGPFSDPTRRKPTVHPDAVTFHPFPFTVEGYGWRAPFSEPARRQVRIQPDAQSWSYFTPAPTEVVTVDKWFSAFAEQARIKVGLGAHLQKPVTLDPFPITVEAYRWQQPFSEPVRIRRTAEFPALSYSYFVAVVETVTVDKWHQSLSQPTLRKAAVYPAVAFHPFPVTVAEYRWQQPLSEPTRRKADNQPAALYWSGFTPALSTGWIPPLSQPTYRIRFAEYPAVSWSTYTPIAFPGNATSLQVDFFNQLQQPRRVTSVASLPAFTWGYSTPAADVSFTSVVSHVPYARALLYQSVFIAVRPYPGNATSLQVDFFNQLQQPTRTVWSPTTMVFTWLPPSGEPGPTPVTVAPAQPGGYWYEKWEELARLSRRCKDDDECREAFAEAVEATEAVLATVRADASLGRLRKAVARAAEARDLAYALRCCENIRKELTKLNAELMQARAEADEEEEEAIALLLLH